VKKKSIIIISIILVIVLIISLVVIFINNVNKDKKQQEENMNIVSNSYDKIKEEVENYNNLREDISIFINNFYYDRIENDYQTNLNILKDYDETINKITNEVKKLDSKCNTIYSDKDINHICDNYKNDYEVIINVFINDINNYNNKLKLYNEDNYKNLDLFKSNYINDYIDYNQDKIYSKKDEVND